MKKLIIMLMLPFLVYGCSSTWRSSSSVSTVSGVSAIELLREKVPSSQAYLFVFREAGFGGSLTAWPIQLNSKKIGTIKNGGFMLIKVAPGEHYLFPEEHIGVFSTGIEIQTNKINVEGGRRYFFNHSVDNIFSGNNLKLRSTPESQGAKIIAQYSVAGVFNTGAGAAKGGMCKYWNPKEGITDEDKAWKEIRKNIETLRKEAGSLTSSKVKVSAPSVNIKGIDVPFDKVLDAAKIFNKVYALDFKGAAQDTAGEVISYLVPVAGQYKALLDATKTSVEAVLKNWTASLYLMPAYQTLGRMIVDEVKRGAKFKNPYYPSAWLEKGDLYKEMFKRERAIYLNWKESNAYREDFDASTRGTENMARLRQILGYEPIPAQIYSLFYKEAINEQRSFIDVTYHRITEDLMYEEMNVMKPKIIKAVCRKLAK
jgi:hypothetical protein